MTPMHVEHVTCGKARRVAQAIIVTIVMNLLSFRNPAMLLKPFGQIRGIREMDWVGSASDHFRHHHDVAMGSWKDRHRRSVFPDGSSDRQLHDI